LMRNLADSGVFILMISSDMEEVLGVSDRIAVMREGALMGVLEAQDFSEEAVMRLAVAPVMSKENLPTSAHPTPTEIRT
jgi:ribose transport system ATP-binding protein